MSPVALAALVVFAGVLAARAIRARRASRRRYAVAEAMHELRGALTAIQLGTDASEANDALRMQIDRAVDAVRDLDSLVLSGRSPDASSPELVEIGEIVRRRAAAWDRLAFARGGGVELRWQASPAFVRADPKRLCQALDNLIANGLDHGGGIVTLEGRIEERAVHIAISDRGPGIAQPLDDLPRGSWHAPHGHGLAIVRRAVELHRGRLTATRQARGTNVEIELPLAS
jgi:signal transduction histidine kinase